MATQREDEAFLKETGLEDILSQAQEWIAEHMSPDDVFFRDVLADWALNNGFVRQEDSP